MKPLCRELVEKQYIINQVSDPVLSFLVQQCRCRNSNLVVDLFEVLSYVNLEMLHASSQGKYQNQELL